jgi:uncharacterized lipoprotein YbaY
MDARRHLVNAVAVTRVRVQVVLPTRPGGFRPQARVHMAIEDVSLADAPARLVASADFPVTAEGASLGPFELDADLTPVSRDYAVRVHIDQTGDGQITPGDFVSTARHPVPTRADVVELQVPVALVREAP